MADDDDWRSYDRIADRYDPVAGARFRAVAERMWTHLPARARALDVGTGTGIVLQAAERLGRRPRMGAGCDRSPAMLERARAGARWAHLVCGDALELPFPDGTFEVVTVSFVLSHIPEPGRALREADRVLAGPGLVAVTSWAPVSDPCTAYWGDLLTGVLGPGEVERAVAEVIPCEAALSDPARLAAALAGAGFAVTVTDALDFVLTPTVAEFVEDRSLSPGGRLAVSRLGTEGWGRLQAHARSALEARFGATLRHARRALIAVGAKR